MPELLRMAVEILAPLPDEKPLVAADAELLRPQYENLPAKLRAEGVAPAIPWLCGFQLDFRFK